MTHSSAPSCLVLSLTSRGRRGCSRRRRCKLMHPLRPSQAPPARSRPWPRYCRGSAPCTQQALPLGPRGGSGPATWQGQPAAIHSGVAAAGARVAAAAAVAAAGPAAGGGPPPPQGLAAQRSTSGASPEPYGMQQQQHLAHQHAPQAARFQTSKRQQQHQQHAARGAGPASADVLRFSAAAGSGTACPLVR